MDTHSESSNHSSTPSPTLKTLEDQPVAEQDLRSPMQDLFDIQAPKEEEAAPNQLEENELNNDDNNLFNNDSKPPMQRDFVKLAAQRNRRKLLELRSHSNSIKTSQALAESSNPPESEDQPEEKPIENYSRVRLPPINHHRRAPSVETPQANSCEISREVPQHNVSQEEGRQSQRSQLEEFGSDNQSDMQQDEYKRNFYSHVIVKSRPQSSSMYASQAVKKNSIAPAPMISNSMPMRTPSPHKSINMRDSVMPPGSFASETKKSRFGREGPQTGFQKLEAMNGIVLKQKFDVYKNEKGWVPPLRTYVHDFDLTENETGAKMFQANEISSYCAQQCLSNYCRPFHVAINTCNPGESPDDHKAFLMLERECNCSCLWFSRPTIAVRYIEDGRDVMMGSIKDAFSWCGGIQLEVLDKNGALRYTIQGDCCQWGLFCNCKCKTCQEVSFVVKSEARESSLEIVKKNTSWSHVEFPGADRFKFGFTHEVSAEDKALLLSAVLFLEARHFDGDP